MWPLQQSHLCPGAATFPHRLRVKKRGGGTHEMSGRIIWVRAWEMGGVAEVGVVVGVEVERAGQGRGHKPGPIKP